MIKKKEAIWRVNYRISTWLAVKLFSNHLKIRAVGLGYSNFSSSVPSKEIEIYLRCKRYMRMHFGSSYF